VVTVGLNEFGCIRAADCLGNEMTFCDVRTFDAITEASSILSLSLLLFSRRYYKMIGIPDMDRFQLTFNSSSLHFAHANNTLIIKVVLIRPNVCSANNMLIVKVVS